MSFWKNPVKSIKNVAKNPFGSISKEAKNVIGDWNSIAHAVGDPLGHPFGRLNRFTEKQFGVKGLETVADIAAAAGGAFLGGPWGAAAATAGMNKAMGGDWGQSLKAGGVAGLGAYGVGLAGGESAIPGLGSAGAGASSAAPGAISTGLNFGLPTAAEVSGALTGAGGLSSAAGAAGAGAGGAGGILGSIGGMKGALGLGMLGVSALGAQQQAAAQRQMAKQLQGQIKPASDAAKQMLEQYQSGQLTTADSQAIQDYTASAKAQIQQYFANAGISNSEMLNDRLAQVDKQAAAMKSQALQNYFTAGTNALAGTYTPYAQALQTMYGADNNAMSSLTNSLGMLYFSQGMGGALGSTG